MYQGCRTKAMLGSISLSMAGELQRARLFAGTAKALFEALTTNPQTRNRKHHFSA